MIRHTPSFLISIIIHSLLLVAFFYTYRYVSSLNSNKDDEKLCLKLTCIAEEHKEHVKKKSEPKKIIPKTIKPKVEKPKKEVVKKTVVKKTVKEAVIEKEPVQVVEVDVRKRNFFRRLFGLRK